MDNNGLVFFSNCCLIGVLCMIHIALLYCCHRYVNNDSMSCKSNRPKQLTANAVYNTIIHICYLEHTYKLISMNRIGITYQYYSVYYINLRVFDSIFCMLQTPLVHCLSNFLYNQLLVCEINMTNIIIVFFHKHLYLNHLMTHIMMFYLCCGIHKVLIHCWCSCVNSDLKLCELPMYKFKIYDYIPIIIPFYYITLTIYKHVCYILFTVTIIVEDPNLYECMNVCMLRLLYNYYE